MAIPGWVWPDRRFGDQKTLSSGEPLGASEIENATSLFKLLSNPIRLEILASLYGQTDPVTYTKLRESTSVSDKGQFNYHLRQLEGFVRNRGGGYALSERGEKLMRGVLSEEQIHQYE